MTTNRRRIASILGFVLATLVAVGCPFPRGFDTGVDDDGDTGDAAGPSCDDPITIEGPINTSRELEGCYTATSGLTVERGATLTLIPGTVIEFPENTGLTVNGELDARGSAAEPIVLTGTEETPGWWNGVTFDRTDGSTTVLDHVVIEYGGTSGGAALALTNCCDESTSISLTNSTLRSSEGYGFEVGNDDDGFANFSSNTVTDNARGAGRLSADHIDELDGDSDFSGNGTDAIIVNGGVETADVTWPSIGTPLRVTASITAEGAVTISQGNTFEFAENANLEVTGELEVAGAPDAEVTFTGTESKRGWWGGIDYNRTTSAGNAIDHAVIEYGGGPDDANLRTNNCCGDSSSLAVSNTILRESEGYGFRAHPDTTLRRFEDNELTSNAQGAALVDASAVGSLDTSNSFSGNDRNAIIVNGDLENEDDTWHGFETPYVSTDGIAVDERGFLTIQEGATLKFEANQGFVARGELAVEGTAGAPVTFEGTQTTKGHWAGLTVERTDSMNNSLEHLTISDAGGNGDANLAFKTCCGDSVTASVDDVTLENGSNAGIWADNPSDVTLRGCSNISVVECSPKASIDGTGVSLSQFQNDVCN